MLRGALWQDAVTSLPIPLNNVAGASDHERIHPI
jgi:hypothetical protein